MVFEIEAKYILLCELEAFINKLQALKPYYLGSRLETDIYFNHPCRDFKESDEALRIRITRFYDGDKVCRTNIVLTYKGKRIMDGVVKKRVELELGIEDYEVMEKILDYLGFSRFSSFSKKRMMYKIRDCILAIDQLYGVGFFVEIECDSEKIMEIQEFLKECLKPINKTYLEICIETKRCKIIE